MNVNLSRSYLFKDFHDKTRGLLPEEKNSFKLPMHLKEKLLRVINIANSRLKPVKVKVLLLFQKLESAVGAHSYFTTLFTTPSVPGVSFPI